MSIYGIKYLDLFMFGLMAVAVCRVWWLEHKDIHCPTFESDEATCKSEGGMAFSHTRPKEGDSCQTLINKIYKAAGAEQASVKWRKALLLSAAIMTVMWLTVGCFYKPGASGLPSWQIFYLSVLVGYAILLGSYLYYSYHVFGIAETWMREAIKELEAKGCIKN